MRAPLLTLKKSERSRLPEGIDELLGSLLELFGGPGGVSPLGGLLVLHHGARLERWVGAI